MPARPAPNPDSVPNDLVAQTAARISLRAGSFIVTVFGDVVEPRGGRLWIGNIIASCARVGISGTLVRTAVSRLVAAGRLEGAREGRRSHYWLTEDASREFLLAANILFAPRPSADFSFVWLKPDSSEATVATLELAGFRKLGPNWLLGPTARLTPNADLLALRAEAQLPSPALRQLAAQHWEIELHNARYGEFLANFAPVQQGLATRTAMSDETALLLRLLLVHQFRQCALRDPALPDAALPLDWRGTAARQLFATLYLALSPAANACIAENFVDGNSRLATATEGTRQRELALTHWLSTI